MNETLVDFSLEKKKGKIKSKIKKGCMLSILCMGLRLSNLVTENREEDL